MLPSKFGVNWPFGSGKKRKIDFQDGGQLAFLIGTILAIFSSAVITEDIYLKLGLVVHYEKGNSYQ